MIHQYNYEESNFAPFGKKWVGCFSYQPNLITKQKTFSLKIKFIRWFSFHHWLHKTHERIMKAVRNTKRQEFLWWVLPPTFNLSLIHMFFLRKVLDDCDGEGAILFNFGAFLFSLRSFPPFGLFGCWWATRLVLSWCWHWKKNFFFGIIKPELISQQNWQHVIHLPEMESWSAAQRLTEQGNFPTQILPRPLGPGDGKPWGGVRNTPLNT